MASFLNDRVLDSGLSVLTSETTHLYLCSALPATYAEATSTYALGSKASPTVGSPAARSPSGRKVTVSATTGGTGSGAGTVSHYALVDSNNSRLLAATTVSTPKTIASSDPFTTDAFDIGIPGPA